MHVCLFLLALGEERRNGMGSGSWGRAAPCPGVSGLLDSPWKPRGWPCAPMEPDAHPVTRAPLSEQWIKQMNAATMPQCKFSEGKRRENRRSSAEERSQSKAYFHAESVAGPILMGAMGITSGGHPFVPTCLCREHKALLSFLLRIRAASAFFGITCSCFTLGALLKSSDPPLGLFHGSLGQTSSEGSFRTLDFGKVAFPLPGESVSETSLM